MFFFTTRIYNKMAEPPTLVRPQVKKADDTLEDYIEYFERVSIANSWDDAKQAKIFPSLLEVSSKLLSAIPEQDKISFGKIKSFICKSSEPYRDSNMLQLMSIQKLFSETVELYRDRIVKLVELVYPRFAVLNKQQLCRDFFICGLRDPIRSAVLNSNSKKFDDTVSAAIVAVSVLPKGKFFQSDPSKFSRENQQKTESSFKNFDKTKRIRCWNCNRFDHISKDCPSKKRRDVKGKTEQAYMSVEQISYRWFVNVTLNNVRLGLLCDSGASVSALPISMFAPTSRRCEDSMVSVTGQRIHVHGTMSGHVNISGIEIDHDFKVADIGKGIMGMDLLKKLNAQIDFVNGIMFINSNSSGKIQIQLETEFSSVVSENGPVIEECLRISLPEGSENGPLITYYDKVLHENDVDANCCWQLNEISTEEFSSYTKDILEDFEDLCTGTGKTDLIVHSINTGNAEPVRTKPYRLPTALVDGAKSVIKELEREGIVEPSTSDWLNPLILVKKKDSVLPRTCLDFRKLNRKTIGMDQFPIPRVDELLDKLYGKSIFTKIDLRNAYFVVPLDEESKKKTAFVFEGRLLQFTRLPFGLSTACQTFARLTEKVISPLKNVVGYFDDILVASESPAEHQKDVRECLQRLRNVGLKINKEKCKFFRSKVQYLGYVISKNTIAPEESKVQAVIDFPRPSDQKELRRFLGTVGFYRANISKLSVVAAPLYHISGKKSSFVWTPSCEDAFKELKRLLSSFPVRRMPDPDSKFIVIVDASKNGIGSVLQQYDDAMTPFVVEYGSKQFDKSERKWSTMEQEAFAIVWSIKKWRHYLLGKEFELWTDHKPLIWLRTKKDIDNKLGRWCLQLEEYNFIIKHIKGTDNVIADALSRTFPVDSFSIESWKSELEKDEKLLAVIKQFPDKFVSEKGVLMRESGQGKVLVIPKSERSHVLHELHETRFSGHLGSRKVLKKAQERFYWPGLTKDVKLYLQKCEICATRKDSPSNPTAPLQAVDVSCFSPWQRIAIDIIGPIQPVSDANNRFIVVCQDYFSKWIVVQAFRSVDTEVIMTFLMDQVMTKHGFVREIVSDQGSQFESLKFKQFLNTYGIRRLRTTPYHPQSDLVERVNRTLLNMIRSFVDDEKKNWDADLQKLVFAYVTSYHEGIGTSPFEMLRGERAQLPIDVMYSDLKPPVALHRTVLFQKIADVRQNARIVAAYCAKNREKYYNRMKKVKPPRVFRKGELIYWKKPTVKAGISPKLQPKWIGPFEIMCKLSDVTYRIKGNDGTTAVVHVNNIKISHAKGVQRIRKRGRPKKFT